MKQLVATLAAILLVASVFVVLSPDSPSTRLPEATATQLDQTQVLFMLCGAFDTTPDGPLATISASLVSRVRKHLSLSF